MSPDDPRHGTTAGHNAGCRCNPCRAAKLRYDKRRKYEVASGKARTVPAYRARRRVQALQCMGYSGRVIADLMGVHRQVVFDLRRDRFYVVTFEKLCEVYEAYSTTYATGDKVTRVRREAERRGFAPPNAWLDIDDATETPDPGYRELKTRPVAQTVEEWDHLRSLGVSIDQAARQLGVTVGAIERAVERMGEVA